MKKAIMLFYRVLGFELVVSTVEGAILRYRLRVRMVPVSYKLFILILGVAIGGSTVYVYQFYPIVYGGAIILENARIETIHTVEAHTEAKAPVSEWIEAEATAYTASVDETDSSPLIMASGQMVYIGAVACPRHIALGERVELKGLGVYTCEDRMNIRYKNNFDIFMSTKTEAIKFGRQKIEYKIIK